VILPKMLYPHEGRRKKLAQGVVNPASNEIFC